MPLRAFIVFGGRSRRFGWFLLLVKFLRVLMPLRAFIVFGYRFDDCCEPDNRCGSVLMPLRAFIVFGEANAQATMTVLGASAS
jgi:hypothetical protein